MKTVAAIFISRVTRPLGARWQARFVNLATSVANAGACLRDAKRFDEAQQKFVGAIKARPNYAEATVQLAALHLDRNDIPAARKVVDTYLNAFKPNPDVLYAAYNVAHAAKDKMSEQKYSRALCLDFSGTPQARALKCP